MSPQSVALGSSFNVRFIAQTDPDDGDGGVVGQIAMTDPDDKGIVGWVSMTNPANGGILGHIAMIDPDDGGIVGGITGNVSPFRFSTAADSALDESNGDQ